MASSVLGDTPKVQHRRRKTAKERREQKCRAIARAFQTVACALDNVRCHRGGALRDVGIKWYRHILRPQPSDVPYPDFDLWRTHCKVVLQESSGSEEAASRTSSKCHSLEDPQPLQDNDDEQLGSVEEDRESEESASQDDEGEESASRSSIGSEGAHGNVALSHESGCDASDREPEVAVGMQRRIVEDDPEAQRLFQTIYLPGFPHPEDEVGGNDSCCKHSIGDLIRPKLCLAKLKAYECGAVAQVVCSAEDGPCDIFVCYFDDKGDLKEDRKLHFSEHFEKIGTITVFEELMSALPHFPRSTLLQDRGALLMTCAGIFRNMQ